MQISEGSDAERSEVLPPPQRIRLFRCAVSAPPSFAHAAVLTDSRIFWGGVALFACSIGSASPSISAPTSHSSSSAALSLYNNITTTNTPPPSPPCDFCCYPSHSPVRPTREVTSGEAERQCSHRQLCSAHSLLKLHPAAPFTPSPSIAARPVRPSSSTTTTQPHLCPAVFRYHSPSTNPPVRPTYPSALTRCPSPTQVPLPSSRCCCILVPARRRSKDCSLESWHSALRNRTLPPLCCALQCHRHSHRPAAYRPAIVCVAAIITITCARDWKRDTERERVCDRMISWMQALLSEHYQHG